MNHEKYLSSTVGCGAGKEPVKGHLRSRGPNAFSTRIADNAPLAARQARQAIHKGQQMSLAEGMASDRYEGVLAFNEKRNPQFTGK